MRHCSAAAPPLVTIELFGLAIGSRYLLADRRPTGGPLIAKFERSQK
jgi:hypothetical protein